MPVGNFASRSATIQPRTVQCRVDAATVFKSDLSSRGARYHRDACTPQR